MSRKITYNETVPTYGDHRPLWPIYGEYRFLPVQRWLHSLEVSGTSIKGILLSPPNRIE